MEALWHFLKKGAMWILLFPLRLLPVKRERVMIHNDLTGKYAGNPKAVTEDLLVTYPGQFDIVVSVRDPERYGTLRVRGMKVVRSNSPSYFFYSMTASVFVTDSGGFSYLPLRRRQYVINTWHGGGSYKKAGIHAYGDSALIRRDLMLAAKKTDVFLSTCTRCSDTLSEALLLPRKVFWEIGMPRNDMLLHEDPKLRQTIRRELGLREGEKLVLFAPTYRKIQDDSFKDSIAIPYGIDPARVCAALEKRFGGTWRFAFRLHPRVTNREEIPKGEVLDLSDHEDMQDLLCAADAMINDFSSSMWDFMLTGRPSFLFARDLEHYIQTTQVYTPVSEWPFPASTDNDGLENNILNFDEHRYAEDCKRHYGSLGGCETGHATQLVCERVYQKCFQGGR